MKKWRIIETDNFGGDYPDESFVGPAFRDKARAEHVADLINEEASGPNERRFWRVVEDGYKLAPGFSP